MVGGYEGFPGGILRLDHSHFLIPLSIDFKILPKYFVNEAFDEVESKVRDLFHLSF